jgi:hypothetical protein
MLLNDFDCARLALSSRNVIYYKLAEGENTGQTTCKIYIALCQPCNIELPEYFPSPVLKGWMLRKTDQKSRIQICWSSQRPEEEDSEDQSQTDQPIG